MHAQYNTHTNHSRACAKNVHSTDFKMTDFPPVFHFKHRRSLWLRESKRATERERKREGGRDTARAYFTQVFRSAFAPTSPKPCTHRRSSSAATTAACSTARLCCSSLTFFYLEITSHGPQGASCISGISSHVPLKEQWVRPPFFSRVTSFKEHLLFLSRVTSPQGAVG